MSDNVEKIKCIVQHMSANELNEMCRHINLFMNDLDEIVPDYVLYDSLREWAQE